MKKRGKKKSLFDRISFWRVVTIILFIIILLLIFPKSAPTLEGEILSDKIIEARVSAYLAASMQPGTTVLIHSVRNAGQVYALDVTVGNESASLYASKDGRYLFPGALDMADTIPLGGQPAGAYSRTDVAEDDDSVLGSPDAPVTIIEFSDYQCPMCGRFWETTFHKLKEEYVDTGQVKFIFRDFPLSYHPYAQKAAEASECAHEQGRFWDYHDLLFENQKVLSTEKFSAFAVELSLDVARFTECMNSDRYAEEVKKDFADGLAAGVEGTPAFFVNGKLVSGALSFDDFKEIIEEELVYS